MSFWSNLGLGWVLFCFRVVCFVLFFFVCLCFLFFSNLVLVCFFFKFRFGLFVFFPPVFFLMLTDQPLEAFFLMKALLAKLGLKHLFDAIIAFTPNKVLLRKTCFLGRKNHTSLLSIYCASGGGFAGGGRGPCDMCVICPWKSSCSFYNLLYPRKIVGSFAPHRVPNTCPNV